MPPSPHSGPASCAATVTLSRAEQHAHHERSVLLRRCSVDRALGGGVLAGAGEQPPGRLHVSPALLLVPQNHHGIRS